MKVKYSPLKIGFIVILTVGVSVGLYYGFNDVNQLSYTLSLATDVEVSELKTEIQSQESELTKLEKELETAKQNIPEVIPFGQGQYAIGSGYNLWDSRCETPRKTSGGCGALGGDYFKKVEENRQRYIDTVVTPLESKINNLTASLEKNESELSVKDRELYCGITSKIIIFNLDGTRTESSSSIIESIQPLSLPTDDASLKRGDIGVKKIRLIPTIQCESLPAPIKIQNSDLKLVIKSDRTISPISTQDARVKSFELNSSSDYELVIFEIEANSFLKQVDFGNYQSEFYLSVYGSIGVDFEGLDVDGKIVIDRDELVTTLKSEISKSDGIREIAKVVVIEPEPVFTAQEFGLPETSFVPEYYETPDWSFVNDVVIEQEPLNNTNDQRFTVIVLLGFLFVLIALLVRKYTRKMLIEK